MTEKKLYKALACIMNDLVVQKNKIDTGTAGKYKAFTIDGVLEKTKILLPKYEVMTFVNNELHETQYITKTGKYGDNKTTHNVIVKTIVEFCHTETGEIHSSIAYGEASDAGDKALSKAQTDGFKKALCQTFHLFDDDGDKDRMPNDDNEKIVKTIQKPVEKKQEPQKPVEKKQEPQKENNISVSFETLKGYLIESPSIERLNAVWKRGEQYIKNYTTEQQTEIQNIYNGKKQEFTQ
jgi:hypothetical protein